MSITGTEMREKLEILRHKLILTDILKMFREEKLEEATVQQLFSDDGAENAAAIKTVSGLTKIISNIREKMPNLKSKIDQIVEKNRFPDTP